MKKRRTATKTIMAWIVLSKNGKPVEVTHAWGRNYVVAKRKYEAAEWHITERAVRCEIIYRSSTGTTKP